MPLPKIGTEGTLTDRAYETLKEAIVAKELKPDEHLHEEELAAQLGISRTPLRAALQRLEYEHLVRPGRGRGYVVASLSRTDMENVYFMRRVLEPEAARLATGNAGPEEVAHLRELVALQRERVAAGKYLQFLNYDREFHLAVASLADNPYLEQAIATMQLHGHRFLVLDEAVRARSEQSLDEHDALVDAIEAGDSETAAELAFDHVVRTHDVLL